MNDIENKLKAVMVERSQSGIRTYYDCPFCKIKDPIGQLVVTWSTEQFICNHGDSCGATGHISKLAKELNIDSDDWRKPYRAPTRKKEPVKYTPLKVEAQKVDLGIDIEKPEICMDDRIKQIEALFNPEDRLIVCKDNNYGETLEANTSSLENEFYNFTHFKVNHGGPKADDIKDFKYTLVECDDISDMSIQKSYLMGLGLPIRTLTWSGNKSLHAIVMIDADNREEYNRRVSLLHTVCHSAGFNIDKTKDPCRYTRLAGSINTKTGKVQKLIDICIGAKDWNEWEIHTLPRLEETKHTLNTRSFESAAISAGFSSGFLTADYNDSGLKAGGLTLLTGRRNQGKTTFARQIMIATAKQELGVFAYMGEGQKEIEKGFLERLLAQEGELNTSDNGYGRTDWYANELAKLRYNREVAEFIDFYNKPLNLKGPVFDSLMSEMTIKARHGSVLFVIDNMMKLTADQKETFKAQQIIIAKLKEFAVHFKVHIILICHPKKDGTSISGAMEIENTADTILKFQRVFAPSSEDGIHEMELRNVTAIVTNEKVRDGGKAHTMYMEFDPIRQANIEIVYIPEIFQMAADYKRNGFYSREMIYV
jgi:hypothetical protein